jgi:outer membrane protein
MVQKGRSPFFLYVSALLLFFIYITPQAGEKIDLSLDNAVNIAMDNSYRIKQLKLGIERSRQWLIMERAGLKSRVYMRVKAPEFQAVSDYKWDSVAGKDVIVRQNTQKLLANLSIRQPVMLFGYPTNGYLSLNNNIYQYDQLDGENWDQSYYNRYFLKFEQPFFQPNRLKNDLREAELELEENELQFLSDQVEMIEDIAVDYYTLFSHAYSDVIFERYMKNLERIETITDCESQQNGDKSLECIQIQVELNNAREKKAQNLSDFRLQSTRLIQRLRLNPDDSLEIKPVIQITPIQVDLDGAIDYGYTLRPRVRLLEINKQQREIDLTNVKGWNAFNVNIEMTYGLEKQDEDYKSLWREFDNSYSMTVNAYIPIWDWGRRKARIEAQKITIRKTELYQEETKNRIKSEIQNAVMNLQEYQKRALSMSENMQMAEEISNLSITRFETSEISLQDLLQSITRQKETEENFLEAYLGYRKSLLGLTVDTFYDYENNIKLLDKFRSGS